MIFFSKRLLVFPAIVMVFVFSRKAGAQGFHETAARQSYQGIFGSAKAVGMAGSMMGTGADPAAMAVNPAAPGLARKSTAQVSLMPYLHTARSTFRGSEVNSEKAGMPFGNIGISMVNKDENKTGYRGGVFSLSYNRTQLSSRRVSWEGESPYYQSGKPTRNSIIDYWLDNLNQPGYRPSDLISKDYPENQPISSDNFKNDVVLAYGAYLLDSDNNNFVSIFPPSDLSKSGSFSQTMNSGNWNFGYSADFDDRFFLGISVMYQHSSFDADISYRERIRNVYVSLLDTNYQYFQRFKGVEFTIDKSLSQSSRGVGANIGLLYKASDALRLSGSIQLPTLTWITEKYSPKISYNFNGIDYFGTVLTTDEVVWFENEFRYKLRLPARMRAGVTWIAGKSGMLEGSMEITNQGSARLYDGDNYNFTQDNPRISENFGWQVNLRAGGEWRLGEYRIRGGFAYLPTALKSNAPLYLNIPRNQVAFSFGLGGRFDLWYWDLALLNSYYQLKNNYLSGYDQDVSTRMNLLQLHLGMGFYL